MSWDINLFNFIHGLAGWSVLTDALGIFLAKYLPYMLGFAVLVFIANQANLKEKLMVTFHLVLATLISRGILTEIIRYFYNRPRPFVAFGFSPLVSSGGASFPSGHAAFFFALGFIIFSFNRKWGYWFLSFALINGLGRVFVGIHYPSDILGGILTGLVAWGIIHLLFRNKKAAVETATGDGASA